MPALLEPPPLRSGLREKVRRHRAAKRDFLRRIAVRRTAVVLLAVAAPAILADVVLGFGAGIRWIEWLALAGLAVFLLRRWWWRPAREFDEHAAVREIERGFPELGQRLRTAREFEAGAADAGFVRAMLADARRRMDEVEPGRLIDHAGLRRVARVCGAALAAFVIVCLGWRDFRVGLLRLAFPSAGFTYTSVEIVDPQSSFPEGETPRIVARTGGRAADAAVLHFRAEGGDWSTRPMAALQKAREFDAALTGVTRSFDYYVEAGDGRSATRHMRCIVPPKIEEAFADLVYPEYTGLPPERTEGGDVRAVEGTRVRVTFRVSRELEEAIARVPDGRWQKLEKNGREVTLEAELTRGEIVYEVTGRDAEGLELAPVSYKLTGVEDKLPEVKLVEPAKDVTATSIWEIATRVRATDDFGLSRVGVVLMVGEQTKAVITREFAEKTIRDANETGTVRLEEFPLTINDNLKLYAFAEDRKPREDGKRAVSELRAIDIRQFQTRYYAGESMNGMESMPMSSEQFAALNDLIKRQRGVVSRLFVLNESGAPGGDPGAASDAARTEQESVRHDAEELRDGVEKLGLMDAKDFILLDTAVQQMDETSGYLEERMIKLAGRQADRALSSLLELRKRVIRILSKNANRSMPASSEQEEARMKTMSELAAEAERLANEEKDVREQLAGSAGSDAVREQQSAAVVDAGELFAALVTQPEATELALRRMEHAEDAMRKADSALDGDPGGAPPPLQDAEDTLRELAGLLRALDGTRVAETLGELADQARDAQSQVEREARENGANSGQGDQSAGEESRESLEKLAERAETMNDAMRSLAKRGENGENGENGADREAQSALKALMDAARTDSMARDLRDLAAGGDRDAASQLANRLGQLAAGLSDEQRRRIQGQIERLAEARALTENLLNRGGNPEAAQRNGEEQNPNSGAAENGNGGREGAGKRAEGQGRDGNGEGERAQADGEGRTNAQGRNGRGDGPAEENGGGGLGGVGGGNGEYLRRLREIHDDSLVRLIPPLEGDLPDGAFAPEHLEAVKNRLDHLIGALLKFQSASSPDARIPEQYTRMVDEYYRALSDELDSDVQRGKDER